MKFWIIACILLASPLPALADDASPPVPASLSVDGKPDSANGLPEAAQSNSDSHDHIRLGDHYSSETKPAAIAETPTFSVDVHPTAVENAPGHPDAAALNNLPMPMFSAPPAAVRESILAYSTRTPDVTAVPAPTNGPQPERDGASERYDFSYLPTAQTRENTGNFALFEFDAAWKDVRTLSNYPLVFSSTQQYDLRLINGPDTPIWLPALTLPGALHRIGWDFELKTADTGLWNAVVAFNPSIDSDFRSSLSRDAWNWDGRAALLYSPSRELTVLMGALFWDRLSERVLPWGGVTYRPNRYWQFDLLFPQLRVNNYMWDEFGFQTSLYGRIEYHSEAYQIYNETLDRRDRVEFAEWRAMMGVNKDRGMFAYYFEGGWVFSRNVDYKYSLSGFDVTSGAIVRAGVRF